LALARSDHAWECLGSALADGDDDVKAATLPLLRQLGDTQSAALLVRALRVGSFPRSRIAACLDAFAIDLGDVIFPLVASDDALVRFWATTLMQRYPQTPGLAGQLVALTEDPEPIVRKAAVDAIASTDAALAIRALRARLVDETPFVRAHAARALSRLQGASGAQALLPLLADKDWTVRDAAKASLGAIGQTVAPSMLPLLTHPDAFARNGAAEVLQNVGIFERLLALEAKGPSNPERARTIRRLARAGGAFMSNTVVERLNIALRPRAQQLLAQALHEVA
jgi:HEAT repeat protein